VDQKEKVVALDACLSLQRIFVGISIAEKRAHVNTAKRILFSKKGAHLFKTGARHNHALPFQSPISIPNQDHGPFSPEDWAIHSRCRIVGVSGSASGKHLFPRQRLPRQVC